MTKKWYLYLLIIFLCLTLGACGANREPLSETRFLLDTFCTISIYDRQDADLLDSALDECERYEHIFSKTIPESDVSKINEARGEPVSVSPDTIAILREAIRYYELSDGMFDCTIGAVTALWPFGKNFSQPPEPDVVKDALRTVGGDAAPVIIDEDNMTAALSNAEGQLDLGGIAKGYIADRLKEFLYDKGVRSAIIDLGGNVLTLGGKPGGAPFKIGIREPKADSGGTIAYLDTKEQSVVTSGIYERGKSVEGVYYHHIIDPKTGYPADTDVLSVSIISDRSVDGDALSTICVLFGYEKGMELIKNIEKTEALFVLMDGSLQISSENIKCY